MLSPSPNVSDPGVSNPGFRGALSLRPALALLCLIVLTTTPTLALDSDQEQPLFIEADAAEFDENTSQSWYIGNVDIQQGSLRILADRVEVQHRANRQPRIIIATGNPARYRQMPEGETEPVLGQSQRMEYDADSDVLTLIDRAVLIQGEDRFANDRIVYNRTSARVTAGTSAQGVERVKITITPKE
ncbi:Lipopolysaccharide export system protein LptA precursor [Thiorhodovibrio winogradskyi]|uniref:Lipopolysaccharide export system protein LptA n=1 Tax=Thiorhodovibrio winogradskyi TaxID=77007 RepID=A0ABZ0S5D9_9GAMM|nr:lipopolysaccharide transport periplasmic protein LptA [Thiorhodovibrio winogradskyi]